MPDDRAFVAVLSNYGGTYTEFLAFKIAALVIGQPYTEPTPVALPPDVLARFEGFYEVNASGKIHITCKNNQLFSQYGENPLEEVVPLSPNEFFFKDMSLGRLQFVSDTNKVVALKIQARMGSPKVAKKIDKSRLEPGQ